MHLILKKEPPFTSFITRIMATNASTSKYSHQALKLFIQKMQHKYGLDNNDDDDKVEESTSIAVDSTSSASQPTYSGPKINDFSTELFLNSYTESNLSSMVGQRSPKRPLDNNADDVDDDGDMNTTARELVRTVVNYKSRCDHLEQENAAFRVLFADLQQQHESMQRGQPEFCVS